MILAIKDLVQIILAQWVEYQLVVWGQLCQFEAITIPTILANSVTKVTIKEGFKHLYNFAINQEMVVRLVKTMVVIMVKLNLGVTQVMFIVMQVANIVTNLE